MPLPLIAVLAITAFLFLFGVSALTIIMPIFGSMMWALSFLAIAYFIPEIIIYKTERLTLTAKTIFSLIAMVIIVPALLGLQIQSFFGAIAVQPAMGAAGLDGVAAQLQVLGIQPASLGAILVTTAGIVLGLLFIDKFVYKKKLFKRR